MTDERNQDFRLDELRRLGAAEREMELELARLRREIARLVVELLPPHASQAKIAEVVAASGFSRTLVDRVRGGRGMWLRCSGGFTGLDDQYGLAGQGLRSA